MTCTTFTVVLTPLRWESCWFGNSLCQYEAQCFGRIAKEALRGLEAVSSSGANKREVVFIFEALDWALSELRNSGPRPVAPDHTTPAAANWIVESLISGELEQGAWTWHAGVPSTSRNADEASRLNDVELLNLFQVRSLSSLISLRRSVNVIPEATD